MEIWEDRQINPVADEVGALVSVTGPIIEGLLRSVSGSVTNTFGEHSRLPLKVLGHLLNNGDGDCGIAFEYAIHDAIRSRSPAFVGRVSDALEKCGISGGDPVSILFATEKSGAQELISTEPGLVMDNSPMLLSEGGRPVSLRKHLAAVGSTFRIPGSLLNPAQSIKGLWKTELFLGSRHLDRWVYASVRMSPPRLGTAKGMWIAIVPSVAGESDAVRLDDKINTVTCPIPYDRSFMQIFRDGWRIVQALCAWDFEIPGRVDIRNPLHREVARIFIERREFPMGDVLEAIRKFEQPELLTRSKDVVSNVPFEATARLATSAIITPVASTLNTAGHISEVLVRPLG